MNITHDIYGWNSKNPFTKEGRFVYVTEAPALSNNADQAKEDLTKWIDQYKMIDVRVSDKQAEFKKTQELYEEIDEIENKIKEEEAKWDSKNETTIKNLENQKNDKLGKVNVDYSWLFNASDFVGQAPVWIAKQLGTILAGIWHGVGEQVGVNTLVWKVRDKVMRYYQVGSAGADSLLAASDTSTPEMRFNKMLEEITKQSKIEAMKSILQHAQENEIELKYDGGKFSFAGDENEVKAILDKLNALGDHEIVQTALNELKLEGAPNFDKKETATNVLHYLRDINTETIWNKTLAEAQKDLQARDIERNMEKNIEKKIEDKKSVDENIKIKIGWQTKTLREWRMQVMSPTEAKQDLDTKNQKVQKLEKEIRTKERKNRENERTNASNKARREAIDKQIESLQQEITNLQKNPKLVAQIKATKKAELKKTYKGSLETTQGLITQDLEGNINQKEFEKTFKKYFGIDDNIFLKAVNKAVDLFTPDKMSDWQEQKAFLDNFTKELIETEDDAKFDEGIKQYASALGEILPKKEAEESGEDRRVKKEVIDTERIDSIISNIKSARSGYQKSISDFSVSVDDLKDIPPGKWIQEKIDEFKGEKKGLKDPEDNEKIEETERNKLETARNEAREAKENYDIILKNATKDKLLDSNVGKMILDGTLPESSWEQYVKNAQEQQSEILDTQKSLGDMIWEGMKYKPNMLETITDTIDELPTGAKIAGMVFAVLVFTKNPKIFWQKGPGLRTLLTTLGVGGFLGHLGIKAVTKGKIGISKFIQGVVDKAKGAKDQISQFENVGYRNVLLKLLEQDPSQAKSILALTFISKDSVSDLVKKHTERKANGEVIVSSTYYEEVLSRQFNDSNGHNQTLRNYFQKNGITQDVFNKSIQTYLMQVTEKGTAAEGHDYISNKLNPKSKEYDGTWEGYTILDVGFNAVRAELKEASETSTEEMQKLSEHKDALELADYKTTFTSVGMDSINDTLKIKNENGIQKISGKLGGYEVTDIEIDGTNNKLTFTLLGWSKEIPLNNFAPEVWEVETAVASKKKEIPAIKSLLPDDAILKFSAKSGKFSLGESLQFDLTGNKLTNLKWRNGANGDTWYPLEKITSLRWKQALKIGAVTYELTVKKDGIITGLNAESFEKALKGSDGKVEMVDEKKSRILEILGIDEQQMKGYENAGYDFELPNQQFLKIKFNGNSMDVVPWTKMIRIDTSEWIGPYSQKDTLLKLAGFMDTVKVAKPDWWKRWQARRSTFEISPFDGKEIQFDTDGTSDSDRIRLAWESGEFVDKMLSLLNYWYFGWEQGIDANGVDHNRQIEFVWRYKEIESFYEEHQQELENLVIRIRDYWILPMDAENHRAAFYLENNQIKFARDALSDKTLDEISNNFDTSKITQTLPSDKKNYYLMLALNKAWFEMK